MATATELSGFLTPEQIAMLSQVGGTSGGSSGGGISGGAQGAVGTQQDYLTNLLNLTAPLRAATVGRLQGILGGAPASSLPSYAPLRAAIEGQYNVAENQLRSSLPRGGFLDQSLSDLITKRAGAVSGLESDILGRAQNEATQIGFGQVPTAISGLGSSANTLASIAAQQAAQDAQRRAASVQNSSNLGTGLGLLAALLIGGLGGKG